MFTLPIGFIILLGALFASVKMESWPLFFNYHAIVIVVVGSLGVLSLTTPSSILKALYRSIIELFHKGMSIHDHLEEFKNLSQNTPLATRSKNELINYYNEVWQQGLSSELKQSLLLQKREVIENRRIEAIQTLKQLSKYPPALGMTGTVVGLVSLFSTLGNDDASQIGPALALAMTATFFGLALTNFFINPLADRLHVEFMKEKKKLLGIYQILSLINQGDPEAVIINEVNHRENEATEKAA